MSFGSNLQFMRRMHASMTQEELAEKMEVSRQTVSKWEMDNAYPEMEKAVQLSRLFNCSLDELIKGDLNSGSKQYSNIRTEEIKSFQYIRYTVISPMPEDDACGHLNELARILKINEPQIIGWNFPFLSQEQVNVYHMHGYCAALILPEGVTTDIAEVSTQPDVKYAAITIEDPFNNPFSLIPNAYTTLHRFIGVNGFRESDIKRDMIDCFEKVYKNNGVTYMDVYIALHTTGN